MMPSKCTILTSKNNAKYKKASYSRYTLNNEKKKQEIMHANSTNKSIRQQDFIIQNEVDNDNPIIYKTHTIDNNDTMNIPVTKVAPE